MESEKPLDSVIFEPAGVLYEFSLEPVYAHWADILDRSPHDIEKCLQADPIIPRLETGDASTREFFDEINQRLDARLSDDELRAGWSAAVGDLYPEMLELVIRLSSSLRIIGLMNTNQIHGEVFEASFDELHPFFERVFMSYEMGVRKPEDSAFEVVLDYLGVEPDEVAFFDDNPDHISAAGAMGLRAFESGDAQTMNHDLELLTDAMPEFDE